MKSIGSIVIGLGCASILTALAGCGDSGSDTTGGAGSGGSGGGGSSDVCADTQALADERQAELNCENGTGPVQAFCSGILLLAPDCTDEAEALHACGEALPASSWECDAEGYVSTVAGVCAEEQTALEECAPI